MLAALLSCTVTARLTAPPAISWHAVSISDASALPTVESSETAFLESDCIIAFPNAASASECASLERRAAAAAAEYHSGRIATGIDSAGLARLPTIGAAARAAAVGTPCAKAMDADMDAICESILLRTMAAIDDTFPDLRRTLYGDASSTLQQLYHDDALEFSSREPGVNVYDAGGQFLPHKDHQALTVLIPVSDPESFEGGGACHHHPACVALPPPPTTPLTFRAREWSAGTSFWAQDSRGHRVEAPSLTLRPPAGTALVFGGHVTHAGAPVVAGTRTAFVCSFSLRGGRKSTDARAQTSTQSFDVYGDVI